MYSNKFAAKLVNIRQLCKKIMDNLNIFIVLSTYYFTFRLLSRHSKTWARFMVRDVLLPLETTDLSSSRSFSVSLTVYFRFGIADFK